MKHNVSLLGRAAVVACSFVAVLPSTGPAQVAYDSPRGRVEVLGLRHWTLRMLRDSVRHYVPGQELHDAACMVTLRDSLHFADASVQRFEWQRPGEPARSHLTIKLIEPDQAARVQWDVRPRNPHTSLLGDYSPLILPITDSTGGVSVGRIMHWLQNADAVKRQKAMLHAPQSARTDAERVFAFLDRTRGEVDRQRAMSVLRRDGFWVNRMAATLVLSNFAAVDSTWWTLVRALRDPDEGVRVAASEVIRTLPARPVDWSGATRDLRLLLGGTNLLAIDDVLDLLATTEVAPELAAILLRDNAEWVLDHLAAETPMASDRAHSLLVHLNGGRDLGRSRSAWESWIRTL